MTSRYITTLFALVALASPLSAAAQTKDPKQAAQKLYNAWHLKSRRSALKVAEKTAVTKLFSTKWRVMKFEGCTHRDEGGFECIYRDKKLDLSIAMIVDGGVSVGGYNVTSVSFSSEE